MKPAIHQTHFTVLYSYISCFTGPFTSHTILHPNASLKNMGGD